MYNIKALEHEFHLFRIFLRNDSRKYDSEWLDFVVKQHPIDLSQYTTKCAIKGETLDNVYLQNEETMVSDAIGQIMTAICTTQKLVAIIDKLLLCYFFKYRQPQTDTKDFPKEDVHYQTQLIS